MRGYLLDTNIVVYWFDARRPQHECVVRHIQELPEATPLMISAITLGEIEFGLQVSKVSTPEQEASQEELRAFIDTNLPMVLDITKATRISYGALRASVAEQQRAGCGLNRRRHRPRAGTAALFQHRAPVISL